MSNNKSNPIVIKLPQITGTGQPTNLSAYVVDRTGKVTEVAPFAANEARLKTSGDALKRSRLFIGGGFPAQYPASKIDAFALVRAGAYQVSANVNKNNEILITHLPPSIIIPIPLEICQVQGNVSNQTTINGVPQTSPVCTARVHICAVEWYFSWPIWLRPLVPASVVDALKESFTNLRTNPVSLARRTARPTSKPAAAVSLKPLPADVESNIIAATPDTIHEVVFNHAAILYPYLCLWPLFWPWFYRVVEQEVVYTDCNGHFDGLLFNIGTPVDENIYVWVEANINGQWVCVYQPPFPCNTFWNYACGTEINIALDNAAIPPCNCAASVSDGTVWFTAIGGNGIALNIQQDINNVSATIRNVGCTNLYDNNQLCPFGSTLDLYLAFGQTLPPATHYRWSWTYILDSALNPTPQAPAPITGTVERYYLWQTANGSWEGGSILLTDTDSNGNIAYLIPNYDVTSYPGVPSNAEWTGFNFLSASVDSTGLSNGYTVRFDLELLSKNAQGVFESVSVPVATFQVSKDTSVLDGSEPAPYTASGSGNNYLTLDPSTHGNALSFSLKVRVDNSAVTAQINPVELQGSGPAGPCGMIQFANEQQTVELSFVASEPFNFATYSYELNMGTSGTIAFASGYVFATFPYNETGLADFSLSGGEFSDDTSVASLLGNCPSAAFAETLSVASLATDGWVPLSQTGGPYAAFDAAAFALTPAPPGP